MDDVGAKQALLLMQQQQQQQRVRTGRDGLAGRVGSRTAAESAPTIQQQEAGDGGRYALAAELDYGFELTPEEQAWLRAESARELENGHQQLGSGAPADFSPSSTEMHGHVGSLQRFDSRAAVIPKPVPMPVPAYDDNVMLMGDEAVSAEGGLPAFVSTQEQLLLLHRRLTKAVHRVWPLGMGASSGFFRQEPRRLSAGSSCPAGLFFCHHVARGTVGQGVSDLTPHLPAAPPGLPLDLFSFIVPLSTIGQEALASWKQYNGGGESDLEFLAGSLMAWQLGEGAARLGMASGALREEDLLIRLLLLPNEEEAARGEVLRAYAPGMGQAGNVVVRMQAALFSLSIRLQQHRPSPPRSS